jgi:hypothetical protein
MVWRVGLIVRVAARVIIVRVFRPLTAEKNYSNPDEVGGYDGWIESRLTGNCLAFRRDDGRLQFVW